MTLQLPSQPSSRGTPLGSTSTVPIDCKEPLAGGVRERGMVEKLKKAAQRAVVRRLRFRDKCAVLLTRLRHGRKRAALEAMQRAARNSLPKPRR